jgi:hypothetical protein
MTKMYNRKKNMKKSITGYVVPLILVLSAREMHAQGSTTFLSNIAQTSTGSVAVGNNSWVAALFYAGTNPQGYLLNAIQLTITDASGNPSAFTVSLYSAPDILGGNRPGSNLGTFSGSASPAGAGLYSYSAPSGISLSTGTPYFIVITAGTAVANGAYEWSLAGANSYNPADGWAVTGGLSSGVLQSANGTSWTSLSATYPQFAISATPAPEPGALGLLALGGMVVGFRRVRSNSKLKVKS